MTRTVKLSPLPQIRALDVQAAAVPLTTLFAQPKLAYAPTSRPISDKSICL
jgi:hypothetical protein